VVASSFKGLTGRQSGGPGREDVVHEPDRAVGPLFVHGEGPERPDQVGLALASVQMVLAQPGTGAVQQLCRRPAQSQGNALRQGVGIVAASSLESAPARLLQAGRSAQTAAEPRPQALCLGAVDAASAAAGANCLRNARERTTARASRHVVQGAVSGSGLSKGPSQIGQRGSISRAWAKLRARDAQQWVAATSVPLLG